MADLGTNILGLPVAIGLDGSEWVPIVQGGVTKRCQTGLIAALAFRRLFPAAMEAVLDGQGLTLQPKVWVYLTVPFNATISSVRLLANGIGNVTVDLWKCSYAQFDNGVTHPVAADSICGGAPAQIVGDDKGQAVLTNWQPSLNVDDVIAVELPSVSTGNITLLTVSIDLTRNSSAS